MTTQCKKPTIYQQDDSGYNQVESENKKEGLQVKKTLFMMIAVIVFVSVIIAGCSSKEVNESPSDNSTKNNASDKASKEEVVLEFWTASDSYKEETGPGGKLVKDFNEKYKGQITINTRYMPWEQYDTAVQAAFASNSLPDIFQVPTNLDLRTVVEKEMAGPIDAMVSEEWKNEFMEGSFAEGINVFDGKIYSFPLRGPQLNSVLYYNKDLLKEAGYTAPPKTWAEFREMSKKASELRKGDTYGLVMGLATPKAARFVISGFSNLDTGTNPEDDWGFNYKTGQYYYDDPKIIKSIEFTNQLKKDGSILPSSYTFKDAEAGALFGNGKSAFFISGRYWMWQIKRDFPELNFDLAVVPTENGDQSYQHYVLATPSRVVITSKNTKHPEEVGKALMEVMASKDYYVDSIRSGVALAPFDSLNEDKSLYPYPEFQTFYDLHNQYLRVRPEPAVANPDTSLVVTAMGGLSQPKIQPDFAGLLQMIFTGKTEDIQGSLSDYNQKMNDGLKNAVEKVKSEGVAVELEDFSFPNWNPSENFTTNDYK